MHVSRPREPGPVSPIEEPPTSPNRAESPSTVRKLDFESASLTEVISPDRPDVQSVRWADPVETPPSGTRLSTLGRNYGPDVAETRAALSAPGSKCWRHGRHHRHLDPGAPRRL